MLVAVGDQHTAAAGRARHFIVMHAVSRKHHLPRIQPAARNEAAGQALFLLGIDIADAKHFLKIRSDRVTGKLIMQVIKA